jgi:hypothetical protein
MSTDLPSASWRKPDDSSSVDGDETNGPDIRRAEMVLRVVCDYGCHDVNHAILCYIEEGS